MFHVLYLVQFTFDLLYHNLKILPWCCYIWSKSGNNTNCISFSVFDGDYTIMLYVDGILIFVSLTILIFRCIWIFDYSRLFTSMWFTCRFFCVIINLSIRIWRGENMAMWNPWKGCKKCSDGCRYCYIYKGNAKRGVDTSIIEKTIALIFMIFFFFIIYHLSYYSIYTLTVPMNAEFIFSLFVCS